jgi:hypothetical protein
MMMLPFIMLAVVLLQQQQLQDSVIVSQAVRGLGDAVRLYVLPSVSVLLLGIAAALVEWIRRILKNSAERMNKAAIAKAEQDRKFQEVLEATSARTLVAAANAKVAAEQMVMQTDEMNNKLTHIEKLSEETAHNVNAAADKAQRQIDNLSQQLLEKGMQPEKGNGPEKKAP